jgi:hypothetical protein
MTRRFFLKALGVAATIPLLETPFFVEEEGDADQPNTVETPKYTPAEISSKMTYLGSWSIPDAFEYPYGLYVNRHFVSDEILGSSIVNVSGIVRERMDEDARVFMRGALYNAYVNDPLTRTHIDSLGGKGLPCTLVKVAEQRQDVKFGREITAFYVLAKNDLKFLDRSCSGIFLPNTIFPKELDHVTWYRQTNTGLGVMSDWETECITFRKLHTTKKGLSFLTYKPLGEDSVLESLSAGSEKDWFVKLQQARSEEFRGNVHTMDFRSLTPDFDHRYPETPLSAILRLCVDNLTNLG